MDYFVKVVFPKKQEKQTKPLAKTKMMLNFANRILKASNSKS